MDSITDDVAVVGGRCAGAPAAMLLARAGLSVRLLERSARLGDVVSGHLIKPAGVARLRRWNLLDAVLATGCPALDDRVLWLGGQPHRPPSAPPGPARSHRAGRRSTRSCWPRPRKRASKSRWGYRCTACRARAGASPE